MMAENPQVERQTLDQLGRLVGDALPHATACWLAGSRVEGLGNANSDLDVYAIVPHTRDIAAIKRSPNGVVVQVYFNESLRVDIEHWPEDVVRQLAEKLRAVDPHDLSVNTLDAIGEAEVDFIHRILTGKNIGDGGGHQAFSNLFSANHLADYLMYNQIIYLDDAVEDAIGMLESGDWRCAALRARDAVGFAADVLLHASGDTNNRAKYRWPRLSRLAAQQPDLQQWVENWWNAQGVLPEDGLGLTQFSLATLTLGEKAASIAETLRACR